LPQFLKVPCFLDKILNKVFFSKTYLGGALSQTA
jgi:hypothetical protein